MKPPNPAGPEYVTREVLLAAAARAVLAALREPLDQRRLSGPAVASLRVLETALESYAFDLPGPQIRPDCK